MGVPNVSLFVKKYLWHYRMMGLYMKTWENINGFCLVIVMAGSMASGIFAMMQGMSAAIVFSQLLAGVFATGVLLLIEYIANTSNLFDMLQVDITDYLLDRENTIELCVVGSPRNMFGPFHQTYTGCSRISWEDFRTTGRFYTSDYVLKPYGLMGQITIFMK